MISRYVLARDRTADAGKIRRDLPPDVAAIEIVKAGLRQVRQRCGECFLLQYGSSRRRLALDQESRGKARHGSKFGKLGLGKLCLTPRHRIALTRGAACCREQDLERQFAAICSGDVEGKHPAADRAGDGQRGEWPAVWDRFIVAVKFRPRLAAGGTGSHDGTYSSVGFADQPKAIATNMVHVRIDGRNGGRHRHHGFDCVTALSED